MDFFAGEAELVGWNRVKDHDGGIVENPSEEFKAYCFSNNENEYIEELEKIEIESRFRDTVLNFLTSIKELSERSSKITGLAFFVGILVGAVVSTVAVRLL